MLLENPELGLIHLSGEEVEIDLKREEKLFDSSESGASDLLPGIYEGGLKIWECAVDLARLLEQEEIDGKCVLELGCGAGKIEPVIPEVKYPVIHPFMDDFSCVSFWELLYR